MKLKISRSFSRKIQLKEYEPIESFCVAEVEIDRMNQSNFTGKKFDPQIKEYDEAESWSERLDKFVQSEVEKSLKPFLDKRDTCQVCGGKNVYGGESLVDGIHPKCRTTEGYKLKNL